MLGNWWFPLDIFLVPQPNGDLKYYAPGIVGALYVWNAGSGTYMPPPGAFDSMVVSAGGTWTRITTTGMAWHFNAAGYLDYIRNRYGLQTTITRDSQNRVTSWLDYAGRTTTVSYYANGYASSVVDWGGRAISFTYTVQGYLASIAFPSTTFWDSALQQIVTRSRTLSFTYVSGTNSALDGNLVIVFDDSGSSALSNTFDALDRATSSTFRGGAWTYSYLPNGATRVVDPDGLTVDYNFDAAGFVNRKDIWTRSGLGLQPLRAGEPASYVWLYQRNSGCGCALVTQITRPDGSTIAYTYDGWGSVTSRVRTNAATTESMTETWTWSPFTQYCRLLTSTSPEGNRPGAIASDWTYTYTYDSLGSLTGVQLPLATVAGGSSLHPQATYGRNNIGQLTSYTSPIGALTTYEYYPTTLELKKIVATSSGGNATTQMTYDGYGRLLTITDPRGSVTTLTYDALDEVTRVAGPQPLAAGHDFLYDQFGNLHKEEIENKDATGTIISANPSFTNRFVYNLLDQVVQRDLEIDAGTVATEAYTYTQAGRPETTTDANGSVIKTFYDERGLVFTGVEGFGTASAGAHVYAYDYLGQLREDKNPRNYATTFDIDYAGRLKQVTYPDGAYELVAWDLDSRVVDLQRRSASGALLRRTSYSRDPAGNLLALQRHLLDGQGASVRTLDETYRADAALHPVTHTWPNGGVVAREHDGLGRVSKITDPNGDTIEYTYDLGGNCTSIVTRTTNQATSQVEQAVVEWTYDALGRAIARVRRDALSSAVQTESCEYDGLGRTTRTVDTLGNTVAYAYDALGRQLSATRDLRVGGVGTGAVTGTVATTRTWDAGGRVLTELDPLGNATGYQYDARNRLTLVTSVAATRAHAYDANGNVTTLTDEVGTVTTSAYDSRDRLTARAVARAAGVLGTIAETYTYDGIGRLVQASDDDSVVTATFDSLDRVTAEAQGALAFAYTYRDDGPLATITYPDATIEPRVYDAGERLTSLSIAGGGPTLATYTYAGGRVPVLTLPGGVTRAAGFDALFRTTQVEYANGGGSIKKFQYGWTAGNVRGYEKRVHAGGTGDVYGFDSLYRAGSVKVGVADPAAEFAIPGSQTVTSSFAIAYDASGSRSSVTVTGAGAGTTNYAVDGRDFYTTVGGVTHVRDAAGNLRDDGVNTYRYDFRNRLVDVTRKATSLVIASYEYDVFGRRLAKTVGTATTTFGWIREELAVEYDAAGLLSRRHLGWRESEVVAAFQRDLLDTDADNSTTDFVWMYPLYDGGFDCVGLLDLNGNLLESYVYTYDGSVAITNAAGNPIQASGMKWQQGYGLLYRDDETGFLYARNRYYDPDQGRFVTEDPATRWHDPAAVGNGFTYLGNSYRQGFDPSGLAKQDCPCAMSYAIFVLIEEGAMWGGNPNDAYRDHARRIGSALRERYSGGAGAGSRVHEYRQAAGQSAADQKKESDRFKKEVEALKLKNDPCFESFVYVGHGVGGRLTIWGEEFSAGPSGPNPLFGSGQRIDFIGIYACGGGHDRGGWESHASDTVVSGHMDIYPTNTRDPNRQGSRSKSDQHAENVANGIRGAGL